MRSTPREPGKESGTVPTNRHTPQRFRWKRNIALLLLLLIAVFLGGLIWTVSADHTHLKDNAENLLGELLQREVSIDGALHVRLGRNINLDATRIRIASTDWTREPELLSVDRLSTSISLFSLLSNEVTVDVLTISGLKLFLERNADDEDNWSIPALDSASTDTEKPAARAHIPVRVRQLLLSDSRVEYRSPKRDKALTVSINTLTEAIAPDQHIALILNGRVNDTPVALNTTVNSIENFNALRDVRIEFSGNLGKVDFGGQLQFDDLLKPARPVANVKLHGPDFDYLAHVLGLTPVSPGPLTFELQIEPEDAQMRVKLAGQFGEFEIGASGTFDNLQSLHAGQLSVNADGPNANAVATAFGLEGLPDAAFTVQGEFKKTGATVEFRDTRVVLGDTTLTGDATFANFPHTSGASAAVVLKGQHLEKFASLTRLDDKLAGPFDATLTLQGHDNRAAEFKLLGTLPAGTLSLTGQIVDAAGLAGLPTARLQYSISGPDLDHLLPPQYRRESGPAQPFRLSGDASVDETTVVSSATEFVLGKTTATGTLTSRRAAPLDGVDAKIHLQSSDLFAFVSTFTEIDGPDDIPLTLQLDATLNDKFLRIIELEAQSQGISLTTSGNIKRSPGFIGSALTFKLTASNAKTLGALAGLTLPQEYLSASFQMDSIENELQIDDLLIRLGKNEFQGTLAARGGEKPDVRLKLHSPVLDVSAYFDNGPAKKATKQAKKGERLIPETRVPMELLQGANGRFSITIDKWLNHHRELSDILVHGAVQNGELLVDDFHLTGEFGGTWPEVSVCGPRAKVPD
ncbi:MAG TPA: AsmA family protein [Woeseiaceae bacterium]|nr:AsmA family protein [Woeseiaceae bacterium]